MLELSASQYDIWTTEQMLGGASVALSGSILYDKNTFSYTYSEMGNAVRKVIHCNDALKIKIISNGIHPFQETSEKLQCSIEKFQCFLQAPRVGFCRTKMQVSAPTKCR